MPEPLKVQRAEDSGVAAVTPAQEALTKPARARRRTAPQWTDEADAASEAVLASWGKELGQAARQQSRLAGRALVDPEDVRKAAKALMSPKEDRVAEVQLWVASIVIGALLGYAATYASAAELRAVVPWWLNLILIALGVGSAVVAGYALRAKSR